MSKIQYKTVCSICRLRFEYDKMLCRALDNKIIELNHSRICRECLRKKQIEDLNDEYLVFRWKSILRL